MLYLFIGNSQHDTQMHLLSQENTACLANCVQKTHEKCVLSPVVALWRKHLRQICLLTTVSGELNGQTTIGVVKGAGRTKTHWEYTAPADQ